LEEEETSDQDQHGDTQNPRNQTLMPMRSD